MVMSLKLTSTESTMYLRLKIQKLLLGVQARKDLETLTMKSGIKEPSQAPETTTLLITQVVNTYSQVLRIMELENLCQINAVMTNGKESLCLRHQVQAHTRRQVNLDILKVISLLSKIQYKIHQGHR